ncbi:hypothetical protein ACDL92_11900 [Ihubacter sp. mB4P-1]|uniref:hypothetical protein n=1 Tax=Ihubacter sp. mB4P-1 TaxID=3242370 RepID=UPI00216F3C1B|nr:hypothetical protein [Emergencia sp.]
MSKRISRATIRGKRLDDDCKQAHTTSHEYGSDDNRVFCYGIYGGWDIADKCKECKAYVYNAEPPEGMI